MKKLINIYAFTYLLLGSLVCTGISCTSTKQQEISAASEEAFSDFKNYVASVENSVSDEVIDAADKWREATANIETTYKEKESKLELYADKWNEERKAEIASLKNRYKTFREQQESAREARLASKAQMSATSTNGGVAADFNTTSISLMPATSVRVAFENFVSRLQENKDSYTKEDWQTINAFYAALETRREAIEDQLTSNDKYEIAKAKTKYAAIKGTTLAAPHVKEAASDVKDATKASAKKVGNAAEKVGSEVKSGTKKAVKKVDNKLD
ncbi:DUF6565 domain-containing protein [Adhaeribacter rhizoryzae]|uniref:DUF6565 domain-containing protein n=1 Tax=Adhaeribacter rhizoryzae TaxID=2607907 RepID=A0A5M6DBL9_9BACT|nr:DUF6565 domain-containing protein [Adhaeribacter rhizoryzae]KAA5544773.1 hypothetical protein F0145_13895 [Adhaeribacter rhizoryzae]